MDGAAGPSAPGNAATRSTAAPRADKPPTGSGATAAPSTSPANRCGRFAPPAPPYPTKAHLYRGHPDFAGEVDHAELIARLEAGSYHGWALSTSASALPAVLALCPPGVRVASWHRGERPTRSYGPLNAWEPVIYLGGRLLEGELDDRRVDALAYTSRPRMTDPARVIGAKPAAVAYWMFRLLGARIGDTLDDIYPGSGGIARAWAHYQDPSALLEP